MTPVTYMAARRRAAGGVAAAVAAGAARQQPGPLQRLPAGRLHPGALCLGGALLRRQRCASVLTLPRLRCMKQSGA